MRNCGSAVRLGFALLLVVVALPSSGLATPLDLVVVVEGEEPDGELIAEVSVAESPDRTSAQSVEVPGRVRFAVPPGTTARVSASAPGYWLPPEIVHVADAAEAVTLRLRPTGWLAGEVEVPAGTGEPEELRVRARTLPGSRETLESRWRCPVVERAFRCEIPAGDLDLRLRAKGFVSHYRWGVEVPAHATVAVRTLVLRPGASIVGWVEAPSREFRYDEVRVDIAPVAGSYGPTLGERERMASMVQESRVNRRGFFELGAIAPGSYAVTVRHPDYAPARIAPIQVLEGAETEIRRVDLSPPARLEVRLHTPTDPFRHPWSVELLRVGDVPGHLDEVEHGVASAEGLWRAEGLAPGDFVIQVSDSRGSRWLWQEVTLLPDMPTLDLYLPFDRLEGELTLGGEPLAATLYFGGATGARRIAVRSDEEGKFYVFLPRREEDWFADVIQPEIGLSTRVEGIAVRKLPGQPWAKVRIDLPDTRVYGEVVDEAGEPLPGAFVEAMGEILPPPSVRASEPDGEFELVGLEPGEWRIEGRYSDGQRRLSSDSLPVQVGDREDAERIRLVLREHRVLSGIVVAPDGRGIPGATVVARIDKTQRWVSGVIPQAATHVDGVFKLSFPDGAESVILSVLAPGFALRTLRVNALAEEPLVVSVEAAGGTVVISYGDSEGITPALLRHDTALFQPDRVAAAGLLQNWALAHGVRQDEPERFVVPMLEPGSYTACFKPGATTFFSGRLPQGALPDRCSRGELAPYGELHLTVPIPDEAAARGENR